MLFNLFLTIFGLPVLIAMFIDDKMARNRAEREYQAKKAEEQSRIDAWCERVTDRLLERGIRVAVANKLPWVKEELESLEGEIPYVASSLLEAPEGSKQYEIIVRILMARRGKLTMNDASKGIDSWSACTAHENWSIHLNMRIIKKLVIWIDKQLKEHGINEGLFSMSDWDGRMVPVRETDDRIGCKYLWFPMAPYNYYIVEYK